MAWTIDDSIQRAAYDANKHFEVDASSMRKYHDWKSKVTQLNLHPKQAAEAAGDMNYEQLSGKNKGQYTIRISKAHRVAFTIDAVQQVVNVFQIGGHYPDDRN